MAADPGYDKHSSNRSMGCCSAGTESDGTELGFGVTRYPLQ